MKFKNKKVKILFVIHVNMDELMSEENWKSKIPMVCRLNA